MSSKRYFSLSRWIFIFCSLFLRGGFEFSHTQKNLIHLTCIMISGQWCLENVGVIGALIIKETEYLNVSFCCFHILNIRWTNCFWALSGCFNLYYAFLCWNYLGLWFTFQMVVHVFYFWIEDTWVQMEKASSSYSNQM